MNKIFVDNFAGGGGASTGIEMAIGRSVDIAINHDPDAIAMHTANHPTTKHYELFRAMGFPEDYIIDEIDGKPFSKKQQTAKCGNAVTPQVPEALVRANLPEYCTDTCRWRNAV